MGIFSEIAEEQTEQVYCEGFIHGVFWPVTIPLMLIDKARWRIRWMYWRFKHRNDLPLHPNPEPLPRYASFDELAKRDGRDLRAERTASLEAEQIPCDTYGCKELKPRGSVFCPSCAQDYKEDPDAYK